MASFKSKDNHGIPRFLQVLYDFMDFISSISIVMTYTGIICIAHKLIKNVRLFNKYEKRIMVKLCGRK